MNKKGIAIIGPALIFVKLFSLLIAALQTITSFGLIGALAFNRNLNKIKARVAVLHLVLFIVLTSILMIITHLIIGPTTNHYIPMLITAIPFAILYGLLNIKNFKKDKKLTTKVLLIGTLLFIFTTQIAVFLATK